MIRFCNGRRNKMRKRIHKIFVSLLISMAMLLTALPVWGAEFEDANETESIVGMGAV